MIPYNENSTVRIFWNRDNPTLFGVQFNEHEPPERDPEENAYLAAFEYLGCPRERTGVFTFDLANADHIAVIGRMEKVLGDLDLYIGLVETDDGGGFADFYASGENPDPAAIFNPVTREWDLPENYFEILKERMFEEITARHKEFDETGAAMTSLGFEIQIGAAHAAKLDSAIRFAMMAGLETIYITAADDATHDDISVGAATRALIEQLYTGLMAHRHKQDLRRLVAEAETVEDLLAIEIVFVSMDPGDVPEGWRDLYGDAGQPASEHFTAPTEKARELGGVSGEVAIGCDLGNIVTLAATGGITFTLEANAPAGQTRVLTLIIEGGGAHVITWPAEVNWAGGAPELAADGASVLTFITADNGGTWLGMMSG